MAITKSTPGTINRWDVMVRYYCIVISDVYANVGFHYF
ncbi:Uncharacterised protein [Escherichia coli]|nr:Uncharacterised protein [Escherichia coli]